MGRICRKVALSLTFPIALAAQNSTPDTSPHVQRFIGVEPAVNLEVLDWGGTGRPIVLLAGRGNTAHVFDDFAQRLTGDFHVYGITRRGFGNSTATTSGFLADSLGNDILAVMDSLGVRQPVLIGHSIAGQELSSIGSRHPDCVAGLVYLDAGFQFAVYDSTLGPALVLFRDTQRKLARLADPALSLTLRERGALIEDLLESIPLLERDLHLYQQDIAAQPDKSRILPAPDTNPVIVRLRWASRDTRRSRRLCLPSLPYRANARMHGRVTPRRARDSIR
jgi:pimeloyl-ACP methyl ester carboxylesterase